MVHTSPGSRSQKLDKRHESQAQRRRDLPPGYEVRKYKYKRLSPEESESGRQAVAERRAERKEEKRKKREVAAQAVASDSALLAARPSLPKKPHKPDLRYMKDPSAIAARVVEHLIQMVEYGALKDEYDAELPAFRKAQKRVASRASYALEQQQVFEHRLEHRHELSFDDLCVLQQAERKRARAACEDAVT